MASDHSWGSCIPATFCLKGAVNQIFIAIAIFREDAIVKAWTVNGVVKNKKAKEDKWDQVEPLFHAWSNGYGCSKRELLFKKSILGSLSKANLLDVIKIRCY